ncbi:MAG: NTP transferase domain-containing protein, partial [Gammaproteobacteria bacterium]|nr:NTP transferase domain-containing protein [Gammaproteobacteria bacterium]
MSLSLTAVILAAGQGKRMKSAYPKILHRLGGRMLLEFVIDAALMLDSQKIHVVYGHGGEQIMAAFPDRAQDSVSHTTSHINWVPQTLQLGTGHAVEQAMAHIPDDVLVLVLYGDVPLIKPVMLTEVVSKVGEHSIGLVTVRLPD